MSSEAVKVRTYYDSTRKLFSLIVDGRVTYKLAELVLDNVSFSVRPGGRDRVRETGNKFPHAYILGDFGNQDLAVTRLRRVWGKMVRFSYNPKKLMGFTTEDGQLLDGAGSVWLAVVNRHPVCYAYESRVSQIGESNERLQSV